MEAGRGAGCNPIQAHRGRGRRERGEREGREGERHTERERERGGVGIEERVSAGDAQFAGERSRAARLSPAERLLRTHGGAAAAALALLLLSVHTPRRGQSVGEYSALFPSHTYFYAQVGKGTRARRFGDI